MNPLVTVIIPTLGNYQYLVSCLGSLLAQNYDPLEVIVVFDSRSDQRSIHPQKLREEFKGRFASFIVYESDGLHGAAVNRNIGLKLAQGQYVCFLDDDDEFLPNKLQIQVNFMKNNSYDFSHTDYFRVITAGGIEKVRYIDTSRNQGHFVPQQVSEGVCVIATPTVMIRRSLFLNFPEGPFPEKLVLGEDQIAWMGLAKQSHLGVKHIDQPLSRVHIKPGSLQRAGGGHLATLKNHLLLARMLAKEAKELDIRRSPRVWVANFFINQIGQAHLILLALRDIGIFRNK